MTLNTSVRKAKEDLLKTINETEESIAIDSKLGSPRLDSGIQDALRSVKTINTLVKNTDRALDQLQEETGTNIKALSDAVKQVVGLSDKIIDPEQKATREEAQLLNDTLQSIDQFFQDNERVEIGNNQTLREFLKEFERSDGGNTVLNRTLTDEFDGLGDFLKKNISAISQAGSVATEGAGAGIATDVASSFFGPFGIALGKLVESGAFDPITDSIRDGFSDAKDRLFGSRDQEVTDPTTAIKTLDENIDEFQTTSLENDDAQLAVLNQIADNGRDLKNVTDELSEVKELLEKPVTVQDANLIDNLEAIRQTLTEQTEVLDDGLGDVERKTKRRRGGGAGGLGLLGLLSAAGSGLGSIITGGLGLLLGGGAASGLLSKIFSKEFLKSIGRGLLRFGIRLAKFTLPGLVAGIALFYGEKIADAIGGLFVEDFSIREKLPGLFELADRAQDAVIDFIKNPVEKIEQGIEALKSVSLQEDILEPLTNLTETIADGIGSFVSDFVEDSRKFLENTLPGPLGDLFSKDEAETPVFRGSTTPQASPQLNSKMRSEVRDIDIVPPKEKTDDSNILDEIRQSLDTLARLFASNNQPTGAGNPGLATGGLGTSTDDLSLNMLNEGIT